MKAAEHFPSSVTGRFACVGLGGDGDEVDAIRAVEQAFNVALDYNDAAEWLTAGDVFRSLQITVGSELAHERSTWRRFAQALCSQSGTDPALIGLGSRLLV